MYKRQLFDLKSGQIRNYWEQQASYAKSFMEREFMDEILSLIHISGFLAEQGRDELPVESVSWYLAVDMYVQRQEMRPI